MTAGTLGKPLFDIFDIGTFSNGHPVELYERLRETDPVHAHPGTEKQPTPLWILTRYEDIARVHYDPVRFISSMGNRILTDKKLSLDPRVTRANHRAIIMMDQPEHTELRKVLAPAFSPLAMKKFENRIEQCVMRMLDRLKGRRDVEFVEEIAAVTPIESVGVILGIPEEDWGKLFDWTNVMTGVDDPVFGPSLEASNQTFLEVFEYGNRLIDERRRNPKDDVMTLIAHAELNGKPLDQDVRNGMIAILFAAGNETTRNSTTGALLALQNFPEEKQRLIDNPELTAEAADEFVRYVTPLYQSARTVTEDVEIGGKKIAKGEKVVMLLGAANRDPEMFPDPHRLDVTRSNAKRQFAFGFGIHHCIGGRMALTQLKIVFRELLKRYPKIEPIAEPERLESQFINGVRKLPVRLH